MADKETKLSIVIRTVDKATAKIKAINDKLDAATKPLRNFKEALSDLREKSGLNGVIDGFKSVGGAVLDVVGKIAMIGGAVAAATAGLLSIIDGFDELGDKAERIGVSVDFLAQMRYAAERAGASVDELDGGLQSFSKNLGQARAGTGRMTSFLNKVSPALLRQLKAAKSNEAAFDLLAGAMAKLEDPAKRAALAQATLGDSALGPLFAKGPKGIKELRDRYLELAGSQEEAAGAAGGTDDALKDLKASSDGVKAALVTGLAPALTVIIAKLTKWLTGHRAEIAEWAKNIGEKLPGAVQRIVEWIGKAYDKVSAFIDKIGGLKTIAVIAAAVIVGPLIGALVSLGGALVTAGTAMSALFSGTRVGAFIKQIGGATSAIGGLGAAIAPIGAAIAVDAALDTLQDPATTARANAAIHKLWSSMDIGEAMKIAEGGNGIAEQLAAFKGAVGQGAAAPANAKITVDFANAPKGTRVKSDPSTADVDLSVGYQMGYAP